MKAIRVGLVGCGFVSELHMHAYKRVHGNSSPSKRSRHRATASWSLPRGTGFQGPPPYPGIAERPGNRRDRHLHARRPARADDRRRHGVGETRHLRSLSPAIWLADGPFTGRTPTVKGVDVRTRHGRDGRDPTKDSGERTTLLHVRGKLVYAPAIAKSAEILRKTKRQDLVHEGRRKP